MIASLFAIVIVGVVIYLVGAMIPMPRPIQVVVRIVAVLIIVILLLRLIGVVRIGLP